MSSTESQNLERLQAENEELRTRLAEAQDTLRAIGAGEVDGFVVEGVEGPQVFILQGSDTDSNHFRSDILAKVSDAVIAIDNEYRVIYVNAAAERQYGFTSSEALGKLLTDLYDYHWWNPEDEEQAMSALRTDGHWLGENIHVKRNGEVIHVESSVSRLIGKDGSPSGMLSVIRDVTGRRAAEVALRESEERYRTLFGSIDEGFCVIEMIFDETDKPVNYRYLEVSPSFEKQTGMKDAAGKTVLDFLPGHEQHWFDTYGQVAITGEPVRYENRVEDLGRWYDVYACRFGDPEKRHVAVIFNDITARKEAEDALKSHADELAHADRMKDEFLAMLAHELRNPLAPLRNASEILQFENTGPRERAQAQLLIRRQIENMTRLIDDLLDVSRITQGKIELRRQTVALEPILTSAASLVRNLCSRNRQHLAVTIPSEPIYLNADPTRLEQIFGNLLANACKYSGEESHISMVARVVPDSSPPQLEVRITDDGIGIDRELLPRIFELFVQASRSLDRSHGGLGIGLTVVHRLVKMHEGTIEAHSDGLGKGAEFIVRLPVLTGPVTLSSTTDKPSAGKQGVRMLIVDDNQDSAQSMAMLQEISGHETRVAHNGTDALAIAADFHPEVVLLDIGLPGMDGYEVARQLRAMPGFADSFLIALTGYGTDDDRTRAKEAGFDEHLVKPADLDLLRKWLVERVKNSIG